MADEKNTAILSELDPVINQINKTIEAIIKIGVPESLASLHLDLVNSSETLAEDIAEFKFVESDPIRAIGGISQYEKNAETLQSAQDRLIGAII